MVVAWEKAANFRAESTVRTWLFGIARFQMLQAIQKASKNGHDLDSVHLTSDDNPPEIVERHLDQQALIDAIGGTPAASAASTGTGFLSRIIAQGSRPKHLDIPSIRSRAACTGHAPTSVSF